MKKNTYKPGDKLHTASGVPVKYVNFDKRKQKHILIIDGIEREYSDASMQQTMFIYDKTE